MSGCVKVGLVEASPRFLRNGRPLVFFPYATARLEACARRYAANSQSLEFLPRIAWRVPLAKAVQRLQDADVVGFSAYVWNWQYSLELARLVKQQRGDRLLVFGGPHVPDNAEEFLRSHRFVDVAVHGEGERVFQEVLERAESRDWDSVDSISYLGSDGVFHRTPRRKRTADLDELPSPFLEGFFDRELANRDVAWQSIWETNRGCPFSCTFCDWGSATASKVNPFGMERLEREIDWLLRNSIRSIFIADANFAILPRDLEIARLIAAAARRYGARLNLGVQFTKNASARSAEVQRIFQDSGYIQFEPSVAVQSVDRPALVAIKRDNISLDAFEEVHRAARRQGIPTYTDIIVGLPGETYASFADGVEEVIRRGQHHRAVMYACQVLPNAEMAAPEYRARYGIECVSLPLNPPPRPGARSPFPEESIETIVATRSMPRADWVRARTFAWMTQFLYYGRVLQLPLMVLSGAYQVSLRRAIEAFLSVDAQSLPVCGRVAAEMRAAAESIQQGRHGCSHHNQLPGVWWQPEVYPLVWIGVEERVDAFYGEAESILQSVCVATAGASGALSEAVRLNRSWMTWPAVPETARVDLSYDFRAFYQETQQGLRPVLPVRPVTYAIRRSGDSMRTLTSWLTSLAGSDLGDRFGNLREIDAGEEYRVAAIA